MLNQIYITYEACPESIQPFLNISKTGLVDLM